MKIAIITNSTSYEPRSEKIADFFTNQGHQVSMIESDFIHREKIKGRPAAAGHIYISTIPYYKNLSFRRLYSHYNFAKKTYKHLESVKADAIYVLVPANSLAYFMKKYKKNHKVKLIIDIIDLWPESLPMGRIKKLWPMRCWRDLRNKSLDAADLIVTECRLYQEVLKPFTGTTRMMNLYWPREDETGMAGFKEDNDYIHFCYLGSINHIIDIDFIIRLLSEINKKKRVWLHIIGEGERKEEFIEKLSIEELRYSYHGAIYDEQSKSDIFSLCSYGLNVMKSSVCVGLTMKSVDYMGAGLPIINNIKGDTWSLIEQYHIGYNCDEHNWKEAAEQIKQSHIADQNKRNEVFNLYQELFSQKAFETVLETNLKPLLEN